MLSHDEGELFTKAFLQCYRTTSWAAAGHITGRRSSPVVSGTVRQAASHLASAFRGHLRRSPVHVKDGANMRPFVRSLLKAFENEDPPKNQQRAITPKLLRAMHNRAGVDLPLTHDTLYAIMADLTIMAFFFAMRSCEFTLTPLPGRTKIIRLRGVLFRDQDNQEVDHQSPTLHLAERVTLTFEDQKNGTKMDRRTHQRTGDPTLCPIRSLASLVTRIYRKLPSASLDTTINAMFLDSRETQATSSSLRQFIRSTCTLGGGKPTFGYAANEIGTKSIRSGAAMSLFLMNHPVHKIMILGRWSSDAFLVYIRPQVLEWTNQMSSDMIHFDSFLDVTDPRRAQPSDPRTRQRLFNAGKLDNHPVKMLEMHLHH